ncbi:DUF2459 domain-containing protein [Microvirga roseola]|uniref:DUF2459 domain-containing protein n=1 Tax=Microvirga roseola TaxID=2883126 RepID=UPI001E3DC3B1|nr:DUF2459 domain-containing protein [Microvirga roseola]
MRHILKKGLKGLAALLFLWAGLVVVTARYGDPRIFPGGQGGLDVILVSNGYHAGLAIPRGPLMEMAEDTGLPALLSIGMRFRHYEWLEVGWGDSEFYRSTPTANEVQWRLALKALLGMGEGTVLHVVGIEGRPEQVFPPNGLVTIRLSQDGFVRLAKRLEETFASSPDRQPEEMGPGLYGPSLFYRAAGSFNLFRVCNHWVADLLDAAGVPTAPGIAFLPAGLMADLEWRSGLKPTRSP